MDKKYKITAELEYVAGYLRHGHLEVYLTEEENTHFNSLSKKEKQEFIENHGTIVIDDFRVEHRGKITNITEMEVL